MMHSGMRGGASAFGLGLDIGILFLAVALLVYIGARLYPRVVV